MKKQTLEQKYMVCQYLLFKQGLDELAKKYEIDIIREEYQINGEYFKIEISKRVR